MRELWRADRRLSELIASKLMERPDLRSRLGADFGPDVRERSTAAQSALWQLCVRYERVAGLLEVYVDDDRLMTVPVASLRTTASQN